MPGVIQFIANNTAGTDYVCSDIHGHFSLLQSKLDQAGFDPSVDRLFSLGDLIDRGPECEDALTWLGQDWFYAIQGNHERMLINAVEQRSDHMFMQWHAWGGDWAQDFDPERLNQFYEALSTLPIAIELELGEGKRVALVHAELPDCCDWLDVVEESGCVDKFDIERHQLFSDMLWKKSQLYRDVNTEITLEPVKNIDHVFHGHTIVDFITTYTNRTFMDLGSYLNEDIGLVKPVDYV